MTRPRGRPSEGAREALLEAARGLFVEREYADVSIEDILLRSGVSRGAMYHHFASKLDLFTAVWVESERRALGEIAAEAATAGSPFDVLLEAARAYLRAAASDEELRRIGLVQSRKVLGWERWREQARELGIGTARVLVEAADEAGEIVAEDPELTATIVLGAIIEAAMVVAAAEDDRDAVRRRAQALVVEILEGLRR